MFFDGVGESDVPVVDVQLSTLDVEGSVVHHYRHTKPWQTFIVLLLGEGGCNFTISKTSDLRKVVAVASFDVANV